MSIVKYFFSHHSLKSHFPFHLNRSHLFLPVNEFKETCLCYILLNKLQKKRRFSGIPAPTSVPWFWYWNSSHLRLFPSFPSSAFLSWTSTKKETCLCYILLLENTSTTVCDAKTVWCILCRWWQTRQHQILERKTWILKTGTDLWKHLWKKVPAELH